MIRLFACDLDGTLFNRFHKTDKYIIKTIDQVIEKDCYFVIATGRNMRQQQFKKEFKDRKIYNVCMNGALIYDCHQNLIYEKPIHQYILKDLLMTFPDLHFEFITKNHTYIRSSKKEYIRNFQKIKGWSRFARKPIMTILLKDCLFEQTNEDILKHDILKISCRIVDEKQRKKFDEYLRRHQNDIINAPYSNGIYEITDSQVNKGEAIKRLAALYHIKDDEIAVYGDSGNDIQMLEYFDHSYAPKNAKKEAKKVAKNSIGHNHFHSVAKHIRQTLKENL